MNFRFESKIFPGGLEVRLYGQNGLIPTDLWPTAVPKSFIASVDLAHELAGDDGAAFEPEFLSLMHRTAASLTSKQAANLGMPGPAELLAQLQMRGALGKPGYSADLTWKRITGAYVIVNERLGAFVKIGGEWKRLPCELYDVAERVDELNAAVPEMGAHLAGLAALREVLPIAGIIASIETKGAIGKMTIAVADAFSLDLKGEGDETKLVPILHRAGIAADTPMLPPDKQRAFGEDQFHKFGGVRAFYPVGGDTYVVLSQTLQKALAIVHTTQNRSAKLRKQLFANPRVFLRSALSEELDDAVLESVMRDTQAYSDRVIGLGLWSPRVVPWVKLPPTDWLNGGKNAPAVQPAAEAGIAIGDRHITLDQAQTSDLKAQIEGAIANGQPVVMLTHDGETISVPANLEVLTAIEGVAKGLARGAAGSTGKEADGETRDSPATAPQSESNAKSFKPDVTVIILSNEETVEFEGQQNPRPSPYILSPGIK